MGEYAKGYIIGFYDPILGIRNLSQKMSTSVAFIFSGIGAAVLYILSVISRCIIAHEYLDFPYFVRIAFTSLMTYAIYTFGIAGLAVLVASLQGSKRKYPEVLAAVTMSVMPGALVRILWGHYTSMILGQIGSFFSTLGIVYIAILVMEHVKDDNLSGRKQFLTAALITAGGMAIAAVF